METTWDGLEIASDHPQGSSVVVRRPSRQRGFEYLVLHRASEGVDYEGDWAWTSPAGARFPGEPVHSAALRELHEEAGIEGADVWAVDQSGRWAVFACDVPDDTKVTLHDVEHDRFDWLPAAAALGRILPNEVADTQIGVLERIPPAVVGFRPMSRADLPSMVDWQAEPHVARWWDGDTSTVQAAERRYGARIDGTDPTRLRVIEVNGRSIGWVQDYRIGDHPEYAILTGEPDAIAFDYAIGDPAWVGKGIGTRVVWTFLRDVVRRDYPDASTYFAAPDHRNHASLRMLEKVGFRQGLWFDQPQRGGRVDTVVSCTFDVHKMFG